ncbi:MAG: nuclear transport factor 2 family protein [Bacteroidota bacterium]
MKKTKIVCLLIAACLASTKVSLAQDKAAIEEEVNQTIWKPFSEAYSTLDTEKYLSLHTDDMLRVSAWGLKAGEVFHQSIKEGFERQRKTERKQTIQFWFEHRLYSGNTGYEVGYYKIHISEPGKEDRYYYARFHIVLRKEEGKWKIAQDWDTNKINGVSVTEADFAKGKALAFD